METQNTTDTDTTTVAGQDVSLATRSSSAASGSKKSAGSGANGSLRLSRKVVLLLVGVIVLASAVTGVSIGWASNDNTKTVSSNAAINHNEFQALFLTNGQVYFGKLSDLDSKYVTLTDIFYLQVQQNSTTTQGTASDLNSQSEVSLAKLGSELHGPEDKMSVASDQVLFWENMKPDSKVTQAITKYEAK